MNRIWKMSIMMSLIILIDQITKGVVQAKFFLGESVPVVDGFFNFTYVKNPGAAFGFLASAPVVRSLCFFFCQLLRVWWLITLIWKTRNENLLLCTAYSLILAGAIGNLIDRFSMGYVVDFSTFIMEAVTSAFNVADSSITIAAFLINY